MTKFATTVANQIKNWDMRDVNQLKQLIADLKIECARNELDFQHYVDMSRLPSAPIPADVDTTYPVWAVDAEGKMLVGESADIIETLMEYRENTK